MLSTIDSFTAHLLIVFGVVQIVFLFLLWIHRTK